MTSRAVAVLTALGVLASALGAQGADPVGFAAAVVPETVFVGQQATYSLTVRIPAEIRQRLRRNPEFVPPEPRAMLAYELPLARETGNAEGIETHTFRRALFVLTPGRYTIPSARLTYYLPQTTSFFSREEERTLRSPSVAFVAVDPPSAGRPATWTGAVGVWRASVRVEPTDPRVGDPVVLTLRLEGEGNPTVLPRPTISIPWADVVPQGEQVVLEAAPLMLGGAKEFSWILTPRVEGAQVLASLEYPFFDPLARTYAVARSAPLTLRVRPGTLVALPTRAGSRADSLRMPIRTALAGPARTALPFASVAIWIALLAPLPALVVRFRPRRRRGTAQDRRGEGTARALLEAGLRTRTGIDLAAHTAPGALAAALRLEGVTEATARDVEELRDACDRDAFARRDRRSVGATARERAQALLKRIDAEARRHAHALLLATLLGLGACAGAATSDAESLASFSQGVVAYQGGDFTSARAQFARTVVTAPRDPAAWSNLGTAAWGAADTAMAVVGWQRALRLAPADGELRARLNLVRAPQHRGAARVWPVAPMLVALLALVLWLAGWAWALSAALSGGRLRFASVVLVPAVALAALAWRLDATLAARDLVVIVEPRPLRALPALGAEPGAVPLAGEIARVLRREGVWLLLELDAGREGWYPAERTHGLARD